MKELKRFTNFKDLKAEQNSNNSVGKRNTADEQEWKTFIDVLRKNVKLKLG
jgi:hypothetical protein